MVPVPCLTTVAVPPPSYHRARANHPTAVPVTARTLVTTMHLLDLSRLAVSAAHRRCPRRFQRGRAGAAAPTPRSRGW